MGPAAAVWAYAAGLHPVLPSRPEPVAPASCHETLFPKNEFQKNKFVLQKHKQPQLTKPHRPQRRKHGLRPRMSAHFHCPRGVGRNSRLFSTFNGIPRKGRKCANSAPSPPKAASVSWSRGITPVLEAGGGPGAPFCTFCANGAICFPDADFH